jgi:hypothetical protein
MDVQLADWNGERGHVARCSRHSAANSGFVPQPEQNHDAARSGESVRQHAGRCEQNARAPQVNDPV